MVAVVLKSCSRWISRAPLQKWGATGEGFMTDTSMPMAATSGARDMANSVRNALVLPYMAHEGDGSREAGEEVNMIKPGLLAAFMCGTK